MNNNQDLGTQLEVIARNGLPEMDHGRPENSNESVSY